MGCFSIPVFSPREGAHTHPTHRARLLCEGASLSFIQPRAQLYHLFTLATLSPSLKINPTEQQGHREQQQSQTRATQGLYQRNIVGDGGRVLRDGEQGDSPQVSVCAHPVSPASSADHRETSLGEWQQPSLLYPVSEEIRDFCSSASCKHRKKRKMEKNGEEG